MKKMPKRLYRGTTEEGFVRGLTWDKNYKFTTDIGNAIGYAKQYSKEYSASPLLIVILNPSKFSFKKSKDEGVYLLEGSLTFPNRNIHLINRTEFYQMSRSALEDISLTHSPQTIQIYLGHLFNE